VPAAASARDSHRAPFIAPASLILGSSQCRRAAL
jgi:hypothetical protein